MSAVAPIAAGTLQHTPSQQLPLQPPSQSSLNVHPPPIPALVSSDSTGSGSLYTNSNHAAMIQTQAQAQQIFRQRQLLAYQQQQQIRLQYQQQQQHQQQLQLLVQQKQSPSQPQLKQPQTQSPSPSQALQPGPPASEQQNDLAEVKDEQQQPQPTTKSTSNGLTPIQANDTLQTTTTTATTTPTTTTTTPILTPGSQPFLKNTKRPSGLNKRHSTGLAVLRLLQFAEQLDPGDQALQRAFWDGFIADFFTKSSKTKLGLRNSETDEQKPFYISHYSVAKFFHTLYECGVSSIQLTLEQTMEFILPGGQMNVECPRANFIYRYNNGTLVSSTGHLWVRFSLTPDRIWKIKHFEFACQRNEEFISRSHLVLNKDGSKLKKSNKNALPESPINAWGIPPKAFHILQMMDAAVQMDDILFYSLIAGTTAKDSLAALAFNMEQQRSKGTIMTSAAALDTPDPPASPGGSDSLASPQVPTSKKKQLNNKKPLATRRKSLKNDKIIKQEDADQSESAATTIATTTATAQQGNVSVNLSSPIVKTQNGYPLQQQQQQQQAFFQQQRKMLLEQQAYQQQQQFQSQQPLPIGQTTVSPLPSGLTPSYQQQLPASNPLSQSMPYPSSSQTYTDSFGPQQFSQQQQQHDMDEFIQSPQKHFRKRSDSTNDNNKKPVVSRKKGKTAGTSK
ncbi:LIM-domain binding protein-domain-containing protein [Absidia repens]|uniref:LIM-domain binding protein-domain-containing protein n=1 Tax=Absidia repens TaxID=90262 RepID=A0A1X2IX56_9FUNG|nr:LIM-domain binding protein-domain-containing protein [Absidia repens]